MILKGDSQVVAGIVIFFTGAFVGNSLAREALPAWSLEFVSAFATLAAAYLGARFAFEFNEKRQLEHIREQS